MNFEDFDNLCVAASDVKPDAALSVVSPEPMLVQFGWTWWHSDGTNQCGFGVAIDLRQLELEGRLYMMNMLDTARHAIERSLETTP